MNDNQNYFVTRSTSRVLNIPGGKCSIDIFGDDTNGAPAASSQSNEPVKSTVDSDSTHNPAPAEAKPTNTTHVNATASSASMNEAFKNKQRAMGESFDLFGDEPAKEKKPAGNSPAAAQRTHQTEEQAHKPTGSTEKPISSNQFASSATTNSYNVITARPTSRVLQEPGGKSEDFIFG